MLGVAVTFMALVACGALFEQPSDSTGAQLSIATTELESASATPPFRVFTSIPGRNASTHYTAQVRAAGSTEWSPTMVLMTTGKEPGCGYFAHLTGWTQSWLSLEVNQVDEIEILIQRLSSPIKTASVVPATTGAVVQNVSSEGVIVSLTTMAQVYLAVDGGMNDVDTGPAFTGEMHTMTIFANPILQAPDASDPNVMVIQPSDWDNGANPLAEAPPAGTTVVFEAGVHWPQLAYFHMDVPTVGVPDGYWPIIPTYGSTTYFLQPDAIVMAAMQMNVPWMFKPWALHGYGALSGEAMNRMNPRTNLCTPNHSPQGINVHTSQTLDISGVTMIDFPDHHLLIQGSVSDVNTLHNTKVLGWRANGDGIHVFGKWAVTNQYMRTQDDACYLEGGHITFENITTWNDANGVGFVLGSNVIMRNSNSIYARSVYYWWTGGRVFSHRASPGHPTGFLTNVTNLAIENHKIQDPFPSLNGFQIQEVPSGDDFSFGPDVTFTNIHFAATSTARTCGATNGCNCVPACKLHAPLPYGVPNVIQGWTGATVTGISFNNVTIAGVNIKDMLDGSAPGYFDVTAATVSDITVDGSKVDLIA